LPFNVPEVYQRGLEKIKELSPEAEREIVGVISNAPPLLNAGRLSSRLAEAVVSVIDEPALQAIISSVMALLAIRSSREVSAEELANDVIASMPIWRPLSPSERSELKQRLIRFFSLDTLRVGTKAATLQKNQDRVFRSAMTLTDIRPVFLNEPDSPIAGAMIIHDLKITYFQDGEFRDFYVALDDEDVASLQKVLARAEAKAKNLGSMLESHKIPRLDNQRGAT
jgi:hypothetical protein